MQKLLTGALVILVFYLGYQNQTLTSQIETLKKSASEAPLKTEATPQPFQEPSAQTATRNSSPLARLEAFKTKLRNQQAGLKELQAKRDQLNGRIRELESRDPIEKQRKLSEQREHLKDLEAQKRLIKQNNSEIKNTPEYEDIRRRLKDIEVQIHEIKPGGKKQKGQKATAGSGDFSPESQARLMALREELKRVQNEQKAFLEANSNREGGYQPEGDLSRTIKATKKEIEALEKSANHPEQEIEYLREELEKLNMLITEEGAMIERLSKEIQEVENSR